MEFEKQKKKCLKNIISITFDRLSIFKKNVFVNGFDGVLLLQEKNISFGYFQLPDQHDQVYNDSFQLGKVITWG